MENKNRFKVLSMGNVDVLPMTNEIRRKMELNDLEKRRDEIIGYNKDIANQLNQVAEEFKTIQARVNELTTAKNQLMQQGSVNNGAITEVVQWIDAIKKKEAIEEINKADNVVDIKSKKKK